MLKGYRYVIAAVVVWEAFVGVGSLHCAFARTEQVKRKDDGNRLVTAVGSTAPVIYLREPVDPGCMPGKANRRSELCAQWQAVDAAVAANGYAVWQVAAGFATLAAAIYAAYYARRAAIATEGTVEIAHNAAQSTLRALLQFHDGSVCKSPDQLAESKQKMIINIGVVNRGATPAGMTRSKFSVVAKDETAHYEPWSDYSTI